MSHFASTATGGFVSRAERRSGAYAEPTTGKAVGPGSYELRTSLEASPAPVPFHTSAERNAYNPNFTPGPGAYNSPPTIMGRSAYASTSSAPFTSNAKRLDEDRSRAALPGPGSYDLPAAISVKGSPGRHRYKANNAAERAAVLFKRAPSAPSIPGLGQSYGYEEGGDGGLVLQAPPMPILTGVGRDTVGPGSYELNKDERKGGTTWANSKTSRGLKYGSVAPGPGSYDLAKSTFNAGSSGGLAVKIGGVEVVFGGAQGSSAFASKSLRAHQRDPAEVIPGPGEYDVRPRAGTSPAALGVNSSAIFGSSQPRGQDPVQSLSAPTYWRTPGPGAYDDGRRGVNLKQQAAGSTMLAAAGVVPTPFQTSAMRFASPGAHVPGPGEYKPEEVSSVAFDAAKKAALSRPAGGFGTSSSRFAAPSEAAAGSAPGGGSPLRDRGREVLPGPGNYDPKPLPKPANRTGTSNFASSTGRFRPLTAPPAVPDFTEFDGSGPPKGDPAMLGPGSYSPEKPTGKNRRYQAAKNVPFGTEAARSKLHSVNPTPGPGKYESARALDVVKGAPGAGTPFTVPPPSSGFSSQAGRFHGPGALGQAAYTPGPGAYAGSADSGGLVRKSYNITFQQPNVAA